MNGETHPPPLWVPSYNISMERDEENHIFMGGATPKAAAALNTKIPGFRDLNFRISILRIPRNFWPEIPGSRMAINAMTTFLFTVIYLYILIRSVKMESVELNLEIPEKVELWEKLSEKVRMDIVAVARVERITIEQFLIRSVLTSLEGSAGELQGEYEEELKATERRGPNNQ